MAGGCVWRVLGSRQESAHRRPWKQAWCSGNLLQRNTLLKSVKLLVAVVSDSLRPHGLWPTRLLCPWDSPGMNTGVGCHALLQRNLLDPGIELGSPALQMVSLSTEQPGKPSRINIIL